MDGLHTVHRLDRLTSGLLLLAKTKTAAQSFQAQVIKQCLSSYVPVVAPCDTVGGRWRAVEYLSDM